MKRYWNLKELGVRLKTVDRLFGQIIKRRMELAKQVGQFKMQTGDQIFRSEIEDQRIDETREWARTHGLNPNFLASLLYAVINESCKQQMIQLQAASPNAVAPQSEDEWYEILKKNLLRLTEKWSTTYDQGYEPKKFATQAYLQYERNVIIREIAKLPHGGIMLDLGCATGRACFAYNDTFDRAIGFDISQHMHAKAVELADSRGLLGKLSFECTDLDEGIPLIEDASVSFVLMNLGTASDVRNIRKIVDETRRVLKQGGRFVFSFYNREALLYQPDIIPWQTGLAAVVNIISDSLDVTLEDEDGKEEIVPIYARAYELSEVAELFSPWAESRSLLTYPTMSAMLPEELFSAAAIKQSIAKIDAELAVGSLGAYIIATGSKA